MTSKEKTNYLRIGLGIAGIAVRDATAELIWRTYEGITAKGGQFNIEDAVNIQMSVERKYKALEIKAVKKNESPSK